jgi:hypothetical protein
MSGQCNTAVLRVIASATLGPGAPAENQDMHKAGNRQPAIRTICPPRASGTGDLRCRHSNLARRGMATGYRRRLEGHGQRHRARRDRHPSAQRAGEDPIGQRMRGLGDVIIVDVYYVPAEPRSSRMHCDASARVTGVESPHVGDNSCGYVIMLIEWLRPLGPLRSPSPCTDAQERRVRRCPFFSCPTVDQQRDVNGRWLKLST